MKKFKLHGLEMRETTYELLIARGSLFDSLKDYLVVFVGGIVYMDHSQTRSRYVARQMLIKVPEITLYFWITKILTTGMGEVFSDYLVTHMNPIIAVLLGGMALAATLILQFAVKRYIAWIYWLAVVMVSIFGTMAADVVHIVLHVPYFVSTVFFTIVLAVIFVVWIRKEKTLSIHSVFTFRRELFYWMTVLGTFALGTADGDMTASTLHLGYFTSGVLFTVLLALPALGYRLFGLNGIFAFWFGYIMTRPVGASFSDWLSKPHNIGGLGYGEGKISLILALIIVVMVGFLQVTRVDIKKGKKSQTN